MCIMHRLLCLSGQNMFYSITKERRLQEMYKTDELQNHSFGVSCQQNYIAKYKTKE